MRSESQETRIILLQCTNGYEAIGRLYESRKADDDHMSLSFLCKKAGIPSKGYLSEVLRGKKRLNLKYAEGICAAFNLKKLESDFLQTLLQKDSATNDFHKEQLMARLEELSKALEYQERPSFDSFTDFSLCCEIFCSFGILSEKPTREDFISYFGRQRAFEIDTALSDLSRAELIAKEGEGYKIIKSLVSYIDGGNQQGFHEFIRESILHSAQSASHWLTKPKESFFESTVISVNRKHYYNLLDEMRDLVRNWCATVETEEADSLIRFNVQVFPCANSLKEPSQTTQV